MPFQIYIDSGIFWCMKLRASDFHAALANETRLRALMLLVATGELCVCDLTDALQLGQPQVSRQLGLLREAGLVSARRDGRWVHYRLHSGLPTWAVAVLQETLEGVAGETPFFDDARRLQALSTGRDAVACR